MANQEFTKVICSELMSVLKPLGFRKRRLTFTRDVKDVVQIIALQKSTSSTATLVKMTANAGLWVTELAPIRGGVRDTPDIWSAHWQMRVGHLSPENIDLWWSVKSDSDARVVGAELTRRIITHVLPEMERLSSREAVIQLWRSGAAPGLTAGQRDRYLAKLLGPDV